MSEEILVEEWRKPDIGQFDSDDFEMGAALKYTKVRRLTDGIYMPYLKVGVQAFPIGLSCRDLQQVEWTCWMAAKALLAIIKENQPDVSCPLPDAS